MRDLAVPEKLLSPPLLPMRLIAYLRIALADLDAFGPSTREDDPEAFFNEHGMPPEPTRDWWLRASCGTAFALAQNFVSEDVLLFAEETAELEHVLAHLPFEVEILERVPAEPDERERRSNKGGWLVHRLDGGGHRFPIISLSRETSARCLAELMEARRHKQSYFVDKIAPLPDEPPQEPGAHRFALVRQDDHRSRLRLRLRPQPSRLRALATSAEVASARARTTAVDETQRRHRAGSARGQTKGRTPAPSGGPHASPIRSRRRPGTRS
jgi:hypothetical protein